ncbi:DUF5693 family protein [Paenibacillus spongiae]|uniref:DUF5693 family protein n=1 Tax=Paenibacillus spongiae TaxID=2909671 RepID=A0ABY5SAX3_9BACL|nr:DUF5693 family protein [Paenibacillus spongiae]UVI29920.1 DUF5693 family protein [Paenibacillus spongiae]
MQQSWQQWNRKARALMWVLTLVGVLAALPLGATRWQMEETAKKVEFVFDYRALVQVASYQAHPKAFIDEQLTNMKEAGVHSMAVYESTLEEMIWSGRLSVYDTESASELTGEPIPGDENFTYILFAGKEEETALRPMIEATFEGWDIPVRPWSFEGRSGLVLETPTANALLKPMDPDPLSVQKIRDKGLSIVLRLSDRMAYDQEETEKLLSDYKEMGVQRILFEGNAVKGYRDNPEKKSIAGFASLLKEYGIGIVTIENSKQQKGMNSLAYLSDYNVVRLYSLPDGDAATMSPEAISDRFQLAAKDRNIRMFFLKAAPSRNSEKASVVHPLNNIYEALKGPEGAVAKLEGLGFTMGQAEPFEHTSPSWHKPLKAIICLGAVALIALLISAFLPGTAIPVFLLGLIGSAGLYVVSKPMLEQGLALGAAISAPTLGIIWAVGRVKAHTTGHLRPIGGAGETPAGGMRWFFPGLSAGRRLAMALSIFAMTAVISMLGTPYVFGLLNNITYSLVLEQFRGVSLLHLAPIALSALYVFLYTGDSVIGNLRKLLTMQITVLWVVIAAVLGVVGMYYLSRTGNEGQASQLELVFRNILESTFGVRPRFKEFMLSHPLFLFGLFLALRYRAAWVFFIVGSIGQLSMVDTLAHIHTPLYISLIRVALGLGMGAIIGLVFIAVWQVLEGVWNRWLSRIALKVQHSFKSGA